MKQFYLVSDLSKQLNIPPYRITYLLMTRKLAEPSRIGNRRVFSEADARKVAKALGLSWKPDQQGKEEHGR
jgi:DNA-binding transcriptional MerR regulator